MFCTENEVKAIHHCRCHVYLFIGKVAHQFAPPAFIHGLYSMVVTLVTFTLCLSAQPHKPEIFTQCWVNVGSASLTLGQHWPSIGSMCRGPIHSFRVCMRRRWKNTSGSVAQPSYIIKIIMKSRQCVMSVCCGDTSPVEVVRALRRGYANGVHLSAIWQNTAHLIHWTCAVFPHITRKMNNVCIFSHNQVTYDKGLNALDCSLNYSWSAIWADTDIRLIAKITAKRVRHRT